MALLKRTSFAVVDDAQLVCLLGLMLLRVLAVDVVRRLTSTISVLEGTPDGVLKLFDLLFAQVQLLLRVDFAHVVLSAVAVN